MQTRFELPEFKTVRFTHLNNRPEKRGTGDVPAVDLKFSLNSHNSILALFDPDLPAALYCKFVPNLSNGQSGLDGVEPVSDLPNLRFLAMNPIRWDAEFTGYSLVIDYGLGGKNNLKLEDCTVGKFEFDCKDGGTTVVTFRVQCASGLTEKILGKLPLLINQEVKITLVGPEQDAQITTPPAGPSATDIFVAGAAPGIQ